MKKLLPFFLLLFLGVGNAFSQTFNWARQVAGNSEDWGPRCLRALALT